MLDFDVDFTLLLYIWVNSSACLLLQTWGSFSRGIARTGVGRLLVSVPADRLFSHWEHAPQLWALIRLPKRWPVSQVRNDVWLHQ